MSSIYNLNTLFPNLNAPPVLKSVKTSDLEAVIAEADGLKPAWTLDKKDGVKDDKLSRSELAQFQMQTSAKLQQMQWLKGLYNQYFGNTYDAWFKTSTEALTTKLTAAAVLSKNFNALSDTETDTMGVARAKNETVSATSVRAVAALDGKADDLSTDDIKPLAQRTAAGAYVTRLYEELLGRKPEKGGFDHWTQAYINAKDPVEGSKILLNGIFNSAEYKGNADNTPEVTLDKMFKACYGRSATTAEKETWLPKITANAATALTDLMATDEFKLKQTLNKLPG